jgi:hypothetical protein
MKHYIIVHAISSLLFVILVLVPFNMQRLTNNELNEGLKVLDSQIYSLAKDHVIVGFSVSFTYLTYL